LESLNPRHQAVYNPWLCQIWTPSSPNFDENETVSTKQLPPWKVSTATMLPVNQDIQPSMYSLLPPADELLLRNERDGRHSGSRRELLECRLWLLLSGAGTWSDD
jgi:hypothetical protein